MSESTTANPAPTTASVPSVTHQSTASAPKPVDLTPAPATKPISAAEKLGLRPKGEIQGPKEALGKSATPKSLIKEANDKLRGRHAPKINVPRADVKPKEEKPKPVKKEQEPAAASSEKPDAAKPEDGKPADAKQETGEPEAEKPVDPPKIKIGDKEMTPEEIAEEIKQLREKAESSRKTDEPKDKQPTEKELQAQQDQEKEKLAAARKAFIDAEIAREDDIDEAGLDAILAGGKEAVAKFREIRARDKAETREAIANSVNKALADLQKDYEPLMKHHQEMNAYRTEAEFLNKYPEIKDTPKGIEEARQVRQAMSNYYDQIQQKISQGTATAEERLHAERYEKATPEQFNESVAAWTRERLGIKEAPAAAAKPAEPAEVPAVKPAPAPVKPAPKPPGGQAPTGGSTPTAMNDQQMHIARMRAARV